MADATNFEQQDVPEHVFELIVAPGRDAFCNLNPNDERCLSGRRPLRAAIGNSGTKEKTFRPESSVGEYCCPPIVDGYGLEFGNRTNYDDIKADDLFHIKTNTNSNEITAKRINGNSWGMNLKFNCPLRSEVSGNTCAGEEFPSQSYSERDLLDVRIGNSGTKEKIFRSVSNVGDYCCPPIVDGYGNNFGNRTNRDHSNASDLFHIKTNTTSNEITAKRIDGDSWGMNLKFNCPLRSEVSGNTCAGEEFPSQSYSDMDPIPVYVGSSNSVTKRVSIDQLNIPQGYSLSDFNCPSSVDKTNRINTDHSTAGDTFVINQNDDDGIEVRRTDNDSGWGMNLQFECDYKWSASTPTNLDILNFHNDIRAKCNEEAGPGRGPEPVKWDDNLARMAYELDDIYGDEHSTSDGFIPGTEDQTRRDLNIGENIALSTYRRNGLLDVSNSLDRWSIEGYDGNGLGQGDDGQVQGHYTQMNWNDVEKIGCSVSDAPDNQLRTRCLYQSDSEGIMGNTINEFNNQVHCRRPHSVNPPIDLDRRCPAWAGAGWCSRASPGQLRYLGRKCPLSCRDLWDD